MISLASIKYSPETEAEVVACLRKNAIGQSDYIEKFEVAVAAYVGKRYCIATCSGSMADAVLVAAMKEIYSCRHVIVPALTFIAQPNAVRLNGLDVRFADVRDDFLVDCEKAERALIDDSPAILFATDLMGRVADVGDSKFVVIEDACEAFGSEGAGNGGVAATFSFFPSHTIGIGEGGAIVTDDLEIAQLCRSIRNHGRKAEWTVEAPYNKFHFDHFGFNAKMSGLTAAVGVAEMGHVYESVARRKAIYRIMCDELNEQHHDGACPHGFPLHFGREDDRDKAMRELTAQGIECRKLFSCLPMDEEYYAQRRRASESFPVASYLAHTSLYVPCHQCLNDEEIEHIIYSCKRLQGRVNLQRRV